MNFEGMEIHEMFDKFPILMDRLPDRILLTSPHAFISIKPLLYHSGYRHRVHRWYKDSPSHVCVTFFYKEKSLRSETFFMDYRFLKQTLLKELFPKQPFHEFIRKRTPSIKLFHLAFYHLSTYEIVYIISAFQFKM